MSTSNEIHPAAAATLTVEIEIAAPISATWRHLVEDIGSWWRADFLVSANEPVMTLEPRIGGLLSERCAREGEGFVWGQVIRFEPERHLAFTAQVVPPWGGPALSVVQITLRAEGEGTVLTLVDSLVGHVGEDMLASMDEGWRALLGEGGLKSHVEAPR